MKCTYCFEALACCLQFTSSIFLSEEIISLIIVGVHCNATNTCMIYFTSWNFWLKRILLVKAEMSKQIQQNTIHAKTKLLICDFQVKYFTIRLDVCEAIRNWNRISHENLTAFNILHIQITWTPQPRPPLLLHQKSIRCSDEFFQQYVETVLDSVHDLFVWKFVLDAIGCVYFPYKF